MKLQSEHLDVKKSDHLVEKDFSIKATAKAFDILSSGLYSDKPLAIVRELSCNAWDSHVAANNTKKPFEIKLPTTLDPQFRITDFGTGLSHEDVMELYTTYFDSTKANSNDYIGALGLGSKSPFSYVSTFSVESRHNGKRRLYSAYKSEKGTPAITLMGEEKTDEENGMTISFAVRANDADKFRTAAQKALMYFSPRPKVTGGGSYFNIYELKHTVKGTNWQVREADYYAHMRGAYVVQGAVAYPIDRENLQQSGLSNMHYQILGLDIDFTVPIGAVEFAASREALQYNPDTIRNLIAAIDVAAKEMRSSIQKEFDKCATEWDASVLLATFEDHDHKMNKIFRELHNAKSFTFKGKKIDDEFNIDLSKIKQTQLLLYSKSSYASPGSKAKVHGRWSKDTNVDKTFTLALNHGNVSILVDDSFASGGIMTEVINDIIATNKVKNKDTRVLVIKGETKTSYNQKEIDSILKQLGGASFKFVSSLPYKKAKSASTYRARKSDEVVTWKGFAANGGYRRNQIRRVYSRLCWESAKVDPQDKSVNRYYVMLDRFTITSKGREVEAFDIYLEYVKRIGLLPSDVTVIGLNEKQVARVKSNTKFRDVFAHCAEQFDAKLADGSLFAKVVAERVMSQIGTGVARHMVLSWNTLSKRINDGSFKKTLQTIVDVHELSKKCPHGADAVSNAAGKVSSKFLTETSSKSAELLDAFEAMINKHAMLKLVDWSRVSAKDIDMVIEYINFVASK